MPLEPATGTVITSAWLSVWLKRRIWTWDALVGVATETLVWTETNQNKPALGFIHTLNPKTIFEWLAPNISLQYHPRITHWGHESKGNYYYLKNLLIDTRILLVGILGDVRRTVWRMCILMLGCKGLNGKLIFFSYEWQPCLCIASAITCRLQTKFLNNICTEQMSRQKIEIHIWLRTEIQWNSHLLYFLFPYRIISGIKWRQHTFFSRLTDPSFVSFAGFSETQKEVISIKSWFFLNIDKWTSSNEENWTKFLSQSYGNLTPSLRRSKLTFTLLCALNFLYCSCG